jgi:L-alanine-DL-glutamate epimerase-like enolase superfamily enzyme
MATVAPERTHLAVDALDVVAYRIPTDGPEADGTLEWDATTMVVVEAHAGGATGLGYTYGDVSVAAFVDSQLAGAVCGADALSPPAAWEAMRRATRNAGHPGVGAMAVAAVDVALWDLAARILGMPLARLLGATRRTVPIYGSGGFTSYPLDRLAEQLAGWVAAGIPRVKMKVGAEPADDPGRLDRVRAAIGDAELMVDANGAYSRAEAHGWSHRLPEWDVTWLEEPVSSDDVEGLARTREHAPPGLAIAAGEYVWSRFDAQRLLDGGAVDVLQADVTRCGGPTELRRIDALCAARGVPLSLHCAPAISSHTGCALASLEHLEYFHDHARVEEMLFDGVTEPADGALSPDHERPGHGLELRRADAERFRVA